MSRTNNVQTNACRLVKCSKSCSIFKFNTVTDCQSNPINSTLNTETAVHRFQQTWVLPNKLPYIMKLLLVSKRNENCSRNALTLLKLHIRNDSNINHGMTIKILHLGMH